jgi:hypothetical protein
MSSLGHKDYFTRLFEKLGITMTDNVAHYLNIRERRSEPRDKPKLRPEKQSCTRIRRSIQGYSRIQERQR